MTKNSTKKIPRLRFKGFKGEWEEKRLGDVASIIGGGTPNTKIKEYWNGDINWYSPFEIGSQNYVYSSNKKITSIGLKNSSAKILPKNTVLFTSRAGIGKTAILKKEGCTNQGFQSIIPNKNILDTYFIFCMSEKLKRYGNKMGSGSTFVEISSKEMKKMPLSLPNLNEQQKIGAFFAKLDQLIDLQSKKVEQLKNLKRGYLQKLFPQKGESVPRLRFDGFSGEWEEYKISDIFKVSRGHVLSLNKISNDKTKKNIYPVYSSQTKNNGLLGYYSQYLFDNAITWTTDGANAGTTKFRKGKFFSTNVNGTLFSKNGYSNIAVAEIINSISFKYVSHVGNPKLMSGVMSDIKIKVSSVNELSKISHFIETLDNTINYNNKKVNSLNNLKKAYLQKLFV